MRTISAFTLALLSSTTLFIAPSKADASLEELKARLERAQKENLILKTEKIEKENLTIKAEALEAENAAMHNENKVTKTAALISQSIEPPTPVYSKPQRIVVKLSQNNASAQPKERSEAIKVVDRAIASIPKNDERRELVAVSKAAFDPTPIKQWQGVYAGINAGYGGNAVELSNSTYQPVSGFSAALVSTSTIGVGGPLAGGQVGYNHQFSNNVVLGVESDLDYADINNFSGARKDTNAVAFVFSGSTITQNSTNYDRLGLNWLGTTRLRLGYALGNFLPYISAGIAYGELTSSLLSTNSFGYSYSSGGFLSGAVTSGNNSTTQAGWALGGGAEYKLADAWSIKGEYLYTSLGGITRNDTTIGTAGTVAFGQTSTSTYALHQARVGLNYHTGWLGSSPTVVAKY